MPCSRSSGPRGPLVEVSRQRGVTLREGAAALLATTEKGQALPEEMQRGLRRALHRPPTANRR
ncbi:hypothetical protein [Wenjunlia tyrosinilytica]|nr:hypothetical protein [Wenjunlia tyrosinilytica]